MDANEVKREAQRIQEVWSSGGDVVRELAKMPPLRVACVVARLLADTPPERAGDVERFANLLEYRTGPETGFDLEKVGIPLYVVDEHGIVCPALETAESDTEPGTYCVKVGVHVGELRQSRTGGVPGWLPFDACK